MMTKDLNAVTDLAVRSARRALWRMILLPRFSLRTLLILVTLFSVSGAWIGNWIYRSKQQQRIVTDFRNLPGTPRSPINIAYDDQSLPDENRPVAKSWAPQWLVDKLGKDYFQTVDKLLIGTDEEETQLAALNLAVDLPRLRSLSFFSLGPFDFTPKVLEKISKIKSLEQITISDYLVGDQVPYDKYFSKLPRLKSLTLVIYRTDKFDFSTIAKLHQLTELRLLIHDIRYEDLIKLREMPNITHFTLINTVPEDTPSSIHDVKKLGLIGEIFPKLEEFKLSRPLETNDLQVFNTHSNLKLISLLEPVPDLDKVREMLPKVKIETWER